MRRYIIRLDDAAPKRNIENWNRMERLLDKYDIKPIVGIIPDCKDPEMDQYSFDNAFWDRVHEWDNKKWKIAMHGYEHVYCTEDGGINPVNQRSEFAGLPYEEQKRKIVRGYKILQTHGISAKIFFAPSHTFDINTLKALYKNTDIRIISDTVANDVYKKYGFYFIPQQSGRVRRLPFKTVTFCYHPNTMSDEEFLILELFIKKHQKYFKNMLKKMKPRKKDLLDAFLNKIYFLRR